MCPPKETTNKETRRTNVFAQKQHGREKPKTTAIAGRHADLPQQ
jgi:hypothetical protein